MSDVRCKEVKTGIEAGSIKKFSDIRKILPNKVLYNITGQQLNKSTIKRLDNPELFKVREVLLLSREFKILPEDFFKICVHGLKPKNDTNVRKYLDDKFISDVNRQRLIDVRNAIDTGKIKAFSDLKKFITKTILYNLIGKNPKNALIQNAENPEFLRLNEILTYSKKFKINPEVFFKICIKGVKVEKKIPSKHKGEKFFSKAKYAKELKEKGFTRIQISKELNVSEQQVYRYFKALETE
ncbi:MAG: helix-turn-helix domain-containing protein [Chitinophagaceae bacterium]|jgi:hypothetical protein|nr:helix-turn-helix domain-containing protein [Chitinophagaceae bacterium]